MCNLRASFGPDDKNGFFYAWLYWTEFGLQAFFR